MLRVNTQVMLQQVLTPVNIIETRVVPAPILVKVVSINSVTAVQINSAVQHILVKKLVTPIRKITKANA